MKRLIAAASVFFAIAAPAAAAETRAQGLTGHYYPIGLGYALDRYGVPVPGQQATEERVDAQIAFGPVGARRFVAESDGTAGSILGAPVPWTPAGTGAVIWTGRIRFPQPGTYYLATVGGAPAAVYVNGARVSLGTAPGAVSSAAIAYPDLAASAGVAPGYLVPITVDQPRELPLELRFVGNGAGGGVDLLWVTPDAPRGSGDKPMARLVPTEALGPTVPAVAAADVSPPNSTITSDMLYLPVDGETTAKLSVRLADKAGRPVAGRRVHVVAMAGGGPRDEIRQPEQPTDENGIAVATVRGSTAMGGRRTTTFFAVDVTDLVDVGQSAELVMDDPTTSFLPLTFAPYYDNQSFLVKPLPLKVGQTAHVTVPVMNRTRRPVELAVRFGVRGYNIGASGWVEVGRVEHIALKPGESREVSIDWTPKSGDPHVCMLVHLVGHYTERADSNPIWTRMLAALAELLGASAQAASREEDLNQINQDLDKWNHDPLYGGSPGGGNQGQQGGISDTRQRNLGPVSGLPEWAWNKLKSKIPGMLPGGKNINDLATKGRVSTGLPEVKITAGGHTVLGVGGTVDVGAAPGSDPHGNIFDSNLTVTVDTPVGSKDVTLNTGARIGDPTQQNVSTPGGGLSTPGSHDFTQSGSAVHWHPGCDRQSPEQC